MFQNKIFQVKCFNLEIFEIFQTCPACDTLTAIFYTRTVLTP